MSSTGAAGAPYEDSELSVYGWNWPAAADTEPEPAQGGIYYIRAGGIYSDILTEVAVAVCKVREVRVLAVQLTGSCSWAGLASWLSWEQQPGRPGDTIIIIIIITIIITMTHLLTMLIILWPMADPAAMRVCMLRSTLVWISCMD